MMDFRLLHEVEEVYNEDHLYENQQQNQATLKWNEISNRDISHKV